MQVTNTTTSLFSLFGKDAASGTSDNIKITAQPASSGVFASADSSASASASGDSGATKTFLDYMKKSVGERMRDAWLASHHLTEDQLKSMSASERDAIEKQMAADIKEEMKQKAVKTTPVQGLVTTLAQAM